MKLAFASAASVLVLMAGAALAAPADQPDHQNPKPGTANETMSAMKDATYGLVGQISAEMTSTTKGFVRAAAISDMYEVTAGKIALQRASSSAVKEFAQKMVDDHGKANAQLKALAEKKGISIPTVLSDKCQKKMDELSLKSGAEFDKAYADLMVKDHKEDVDEFKKESEKGNDPELRAWAGETLPTLEHHLKMAESNADALKK